MPKRRNDESKEDRWKRKLKQYEKRLDRKRCRIESNNDDVEMPLHPAVSSVVVASSSRASLAHVCPVPAALMPLDPPPPPPINLPPVEPLPPTQLPVDPSPQLVDPPEVSTLDVPPVSDTLADPELLQALGEYEAETTEWGPEIADALAKRWEPLLRDGLKKENKSDLLKKYLFPKNCPLTKPPVLNPEVAAMLTESAKNRDSRLLEKQRQLGCALSILGKVMSEILTKSVDTQGILRYLTDATKLLSDSHFSETETRRALVTPMLDTTFIEPFKDRKRDGNLFGDKLGDFIKSSRGIQKTGKLIQSTSSLNNLNSKGPPQRIQARSDPRGQARRAGGGAWVNAPRRRTAPSQSPLTPQSRRRSPPPPPPRRKQMSSVAPNNYKH